jgi:hypothetical protein
MEENSFYWELSLNNPEPVEDKYYSYDRLIINDKDFIRISKQLDELINKYEKYKLSDKAKADDTVEELLLLMKNPLAKNSEFFAFWNALDMTRSAFKAQQNKKEILKRLLDAYIEKRKKFYDQKEKSLIIAQALYDAGSSRSNGNTGSCKLEDIIKQSLPNIVKVKTAEEFNKAKFAFFIPDKNNKKEYDEILRQNKIKHSYAFDANQEKECDAILRINDKFLLIEAKHIKEGGGA